MSEKSYRKCCFVLYTDSDDYDYSKVLCDIVNNYEFAYILHDKDLDDNGELKKSHCHVMVNFKTPRKESFIKNRFCVKHIESVSSEKSYLEYMLHLGYDDKYQYNVSELHMSRHYKEIYDKDVCDISILDILFDYIEDGEHEFNYRSFAIYVKNNYDSYVPELLSKAYAINLILKS